MLHLFPKEVPLYLPDSDITYYPDFFNSKVADIYFDQLKKMVPWQQDTIKVFGKIHAQPRLTALYGNNGKSYTYSHITMRPYPFFTELEEIKNKVETVSNVVFTSCLLNFYRDGKDSNGWHADDEKELGQNPIIASVSLGQDRIFKLRPKSNKKATHKILLGHGSLLLMKGSTQHFWQHQIPKTAKPVGERINLTFRVLV